MIIETAKRCSAIGSSETLALSLDNREEQIVRTHWFHGKRARIQASLYNSAEFVQQLYLALC